MEIVSKGFYTKLDDTYKEFLNSSHHAFLIESKNREIVFQYFKDKVENQNISKENLFINLKVFDVEKAKEIIEYAGTDFSDDHIILISFYSINFQAQNKLLKFLEEAPRNIKVVFVAHKGANIIPTILSRVCRLDIKEETVVSKIGEQEYLERTAEKYLATKKINRMNLKEVKDILAKKDEYALENEDKERTDREVLEDFLIQIHDILYNKYKIFLQENKKENESSSMFNYQNNEYVNYLYDIVEAVRYSKNNSSSGKTLLEYLSLRLPEIKD